MVTIPISSIKKQAQEGSLLPVSQVIRLGFQLQSTLLSQPPVPFDLREFVFQFDKQDSSMREPDPRASGRTTVHGQIMGRAENQGGPVLARDSKEDFLEEARQEQVVFKLPYTKRDLIYASF